MSVTVTIAGTDRAAQVDSVVTVERRVSGIGTIQFRVVDDDGGWEPELFDTVAVAMTGQPTRVGTIEVPPEVGYLQLVEGAGTVSFGIDVQVTAHDACAIAGHVMRNAIDVGPITLKGMLQALVTDNLSARGVTLAAGQVTGPTFETLTWPWQTAQQVLDALCAAAAAATGKSWVWRIDDSLVLEAWEVGTKTAPQTLTADDLLEIVPSTDVPGFRNAQYLEFGPSEVRDVTETWTGDGSGRTFPARYRVATRPPQVYDVAAAAYRNVGVYGVDTLFEWVWDAALGQYGGLRQLAEAPPGTPHSPLALGATIEATYASQFPNVVYVEDAASIAAVGLRVAKDAEAAIVDVASATARATALLQASTALARRLAVRTRVHGCDPGEVVTLSVPAIAGLSGAYLIEMVTDSYRAVAGADPDLEHVLDLVAGDLRPSTSEDFMRGVLAGGGGGASASVAVAGGGTSVVTGIGEGDLGGSRVVPVRHSTWAPVGDHREWLCQADGTYTAHVEVWTSHGATGVTPRVYDITAGAVAGSAGSSTTSTTPAKQQLIFEAVAGHVYRLEVLPSNTNAVVFGLGKVR